MTPLRSFTSPAPQPFISVSTETSEASDADPCDRGRRKGAPSPGSANPTGAITPQERRYRDVLGERAWHRLPLAVRRRFSTHVSPGGAIVYIGEVEATELSIFGWLLARAGRLAGSPLPLDHGAKGGATVVVTAAPGGDGQAWTRIYARRAGGPQVIQSTKRFRGPTGLEEDLGHGIVMRLAVTERSGDLVFHSIGYEISFLGRRWALPSWLSPGHCEIVHHDEGDGSFTFTLRLEHVLLGRLVQQRARFRHR